jgi:ribosome modulation factor
MESDAYTQGSFAHDNGDPLDTNPYDHADAQHDEWIDGWLAADWQEEKAANDRA